MQDSKSSLGIQGADALATVVRVAVSALADDRLDANFVELLEGFNRVINVEGVLNTITSAELAAKILNFSQTTFLNSQPQKQEQSSSVILRPL